MKIIIRILIIILLGVSSQNIYSQRIILFNTDADNFPKMSTNILVYDNTGQQLYNLDTLQFRIFENGLERWQKKINCPNPTPPKAISSVLTIDISHSMRDYNRMQIAKNATTAWINALSNNSSECAITTFDAFTYINHSFSTNKNSLINAINQIQPKSGTNYTAAFLGDSGAIKLAAQGKNKRYIIFLTDGEPDESYPPNPTEIINAAKQNNITIYCIALGIGNSTVLKKIADSTGGKFYSSITSIVQAELTYLTILNTLEGTSACSIEWMSDINCGRFRDVAITMPEFYIDAYTSYSLNNNLLPHLEISANNNFDFGKVDSAKTAITKVRLLAKYRDIYFGTLISNNSHFTVKNNITNTTLLGKNSYFDFDIEFKPNDTCRQSAKITFFSDACSGNEFTFLGGTNCISPPVISEEEPRPPLNVLFPNGGETLITGSDTLISWKGISDKDTVKLDYSTNKGVSWINITNKAVGGKYNWKIPNTPSNECLLKVGNNDNNTSYLDSVNIFGLGQLSSADFSDDGLYAVSRSNNGYLIIWDVAKGKILRKLKNEIYYTDLVSWSSKNKIAFGGKSNNVKIYEFDSGNLIEINSELDGNLSVLAWNPDGNRLACGDTRGKINILNTQYQYVMQTLKEYSSGVKDISWDPKGFDLVSGHGDGAILLWNMSSGKPVIKPLGFHSGLASAVAWSPSGLLIASGGVDHRIMIHDTSGIIIKSLAAHTGRITSLAWNPTGSQLISGSDDNIVKIWSSNGTFLKEFRDHNDRILKVKWKNDGNEFYTASADNNIFQRNSNTNTIIKGLNGHIANVNSISFNKVIPSYLITSDNTHKLNFWDYRSGESFRTISDSSSKISCVVYNEQATKIAVGLESGIIKIYNAGTSALIRTLGPVDGHIDRVNSIAWSPDGNSIVSGSSDNVLKVWESSAGTLINNIYCHDDDILTVDWSPDARYIASGGADNLICILSTSQMRLEKTLYDHKDDIISVNWDGDGDSLISSSKDGKIIIWNTLNPKQAKNVLQFAEKSDPSSIFWNIKNNTPVSAGSTDGAILWDTDYGFKKYKYKLIDGNQQNNSIIAKWDHTGKKLITSSNVGTLHLFNLNGIARFVQSDVSDTLWSIISPKVISTNVFMGSVNVGSDTTKVAYAFLANLTKVPVKVDSIKINGSDIVHFDFLIPAVPLYLSPFENYSASFTFHPLSIGEKSCTFTIYTQNEVLEHTISGIGVDKSFTTFNINFGEVEIGEFKDSTTTLIRNNGLADVNISKIVKNGLNCDNFLIANNFLQPFLLTSKTDFNTDIRFQPDKPGFFNCKIEYYPENEQFPAIATLTGYGVIIKPTIIHQINNDIHLQCEDERIDTIFIQNIGRNQLTISSVVLTLNDNNAFEVISYPSNGIDSGQTAFIIIKFHSTNAGVFQGQLNIANNSFNEPDLVIDFNAIKDSVGFKLSSKKITIGPICPNEIGNGVFSIENTSDFDNNFTIISDTLIKPSTLSKSLLKGETDVIEFEFLGYNQTDTLNSFIVIQDSLCNNFDTIFVELRIEKPQLFTQDIIISSDWGSSNIAKLGISNFSDLDIVIDSIVATEVLPFEIITDVRGMQIPSNKTVEIDIKYSALDTLPLTTTFILYAQPCDLIEFLSVTGIPNPTETTISIDTIYAGNNDKIKIPLKFSNESAINISSEYKLNLQVSFNSSLLFPLSKIPTKLNGNGVNDKAIRTIYLEYSGNEIKNDMSLDSDFLVMLGNSDRTKISIDSVKFNTDFIKVNTKNGMLILNDVCHEGGTQLVESSANILLTSIEPNPAKEMVNINFSISETAMVELIIYNNLGQISKILNKNIFSKGNNTYTLNIEDLTSGTYFCVLRNQNNSVREVLQIIR